MGKRSTRKNKNIYQRSREDCALTREAASEQLVFLSPERIEKIESGKSGAHPDEVLAMEKCYHNPELCNWYCTHECPIGAKYVPEAELKSLAQVTVETLAAINALDAEQKNLLAIAVDNRVNGFEREEFDRIYDKLTVLDRSLQSMRIWLEHARQSGGIDEAD